MGVTFLIHGIGKHVEGYHKSWIDALNSTGIDFSKEDFKEILWDPITQKMVDKYGLNETFEKVSKFFEIEMKGKIKSEVVESLTKDGMLDIYLYLTNPEARKYMFDSLQIPLIEEWTSSSRDISIIAHSLGSAISYELLHKLSNSESYLNKRVVNFITIGSAIGIPYMHKDGASDGVFYNPEIRRPNIVTNWRNIYHTLDPVACFYPLKGDYLTYKESMVVSFTTEVHSAEGYLKRKEVAEEIAKFINPIPFG